MSAADAGDGPSFRGVLRRVGRAVGVLLAAVTAVVVAAITFVLVAAWTTSVPTGALLALLLLAGSCYALTWLLGRKLSRRSRRLLAGGTTVAVVATVTLLAAATVFRPAAHPYVAASPTAATRYWDLPNGTRIAYTRTAAAATAPAGRSPVVFLHGGPGVPGEPGGAVLSGPDGLPQAGFDVYVYDQAGSGLSTRRDDARDYTVQRHVDDLEAIRRQIGADKMILIGHSWGSTLAAAYVATHPDRVEKVVYEAPGGLTGEIAPLAPGADERRTPRQRQIEAALISPRVITAFLLGGRNPEAARQLMPDREADGLNSALFPASPSPVCDPAAEVPTPPGTGFWTNVATNNSLRSWDPRPALRTNRTPALVIRPECDYISWETTRSYREAMPQATLVYLRDAGHVVQLDKPAELLDIVRAFLLDRPLPLPAYTGQEPPR